jgi:branched-chain amino acid transport system substrate-binding protein
MREHPVDYVHDRKETMRYKNHGGLLALLLVLGLVAAACGGDSTETTEGSETTTGETTATTTASTEPAGEPAECAADEFGCVAVAPGDPIKIGSLLVTTGPNSSLGLDSQYGVELALDYADGAFDDVNGQIQGHDVALVAEDDGCSAEGGTAGANKLAADTQIVAVIGTSCSSAALGVADKILGDKGVTLISPSNTGPALTDPGTRNPFYYRTAHNDKLQGAAVAEFAYTEQGLTSAATVHDGSPYAEGLANAFAESFQALGGTITSQDAIQVGDTDFSGVLTSIQAGAPELLYFPIFVGEGSLLVQQAKTTLGDTVTLTGSDGLWSDDFYAAAGDGVYLSGPDVSAFAGDAALYADIFLPRYAEKYGSEPLSAFHAHAWDATNVVLAAIEEVAIDSGGTLYIPRSALRDAIGATSGYTGITGTISCNANGDCQPSATIAVFEIAGGVKADTPIFSVVKELEG